ncbi:two-component system, NarL family, sensor histidine kinase DesK [Cellulosimicrobium cellulans]|nr:two-component system, NarL family, sensor histidine kinase DesK [Cellulosimicrobium cellulans]
MDDLPAPRAPSTARPAPGPARPTGPLPPHPATPRPALRGTPRRFRRLNLVTLLPVLVVVGVLLVARQAQTWEQALVLALGVVAVVVAFERWTAGDLGRVAVPCLAVAAVVWPYGVLVVGGEVQAAYYAAAVVGCLVVPELPRHRAGAAVGLVAYVAGVGAWGLLAAGPVTTDGLVSLVIVPTGLTVVLVALRFPNKGFYDVMRELEEAREREAELAVVRERMRFASDLHDIQGHTLHVVKLKIALARRLVGTDPVRAEEELRGTYALVGDTIAQARDLAYGQRRLNLSAELENARRLFEAAGIQVRVDRGADVRDEADDLVSQVLRETTTNVLRHARATLVHVALTERGITIVNDGVPTDEPPTLRGLATLARRVADAGGVLTAEVADGRFRTAATFPPSDGGGLPGPGGAPS